MKDTLRLLKHLQILILWVFTANFLSPFKHLLAVAISALTTVIYSDFSRLDGHLQAHSIGRLLLTLPLHWASSRFTAIIVLVTAFFHGA